MGWDLSNRSKIVLEEKGMREVVIWYYKKQKFHNSYFFQHYYITSRKMVLCIDDLIFGQVFQILRNRFVFAKLYG